VYAGLRRGELLALKWTDIDFAAGVIRIERSYDPRTNQMVAPKSAAGTRRVPILATLRAYLAEHKLAAGDKTGLVFGRTGTDPFTHSTIIRRATAAWKSANAQRVARALRPLAPEASPADLTALAVVCVGLPTDGALAEGALAALVKVGLGAKDAVRTLRGLELLAPITLHVARHSFASLMIAANVNAKALATYMGHSSVTITYDRYGHLMPGDEEQAAHLADAFLESTLARHSEPPRDRP
jgi:integrase